MNKLFIVFLISGFFLLFFIACSVSSKTEQVKTPAPPKPGECTGCHGNKAVIPEDHADTSEMNRDDCNACHESEEMSLKEKIPSGHMHQLSGVSCRECHKNPSEAEPVDQAVCRTCHNDEKALYSATREKALNPHFSPHEGKIPDCNKCHHQHKLSENACNNCHSH